jgi:hypothetical protein
MLGIHGFRAANTALPLARVGSRRRRLPTAVDPVGAVPTCQQRRRRCSRDSGGGCGPAWINHC